MVTLKDIQTRDITADELKTMVVGFESARKYKDVKIEDLDTLVVYKTFSYFVNAFKRLQIPNTIPEETTVTLARVLVDDKAFGIEINFLRKDGSTALNVKWCGKYVTLSNENGVYAEGSWRDDVRPLFKTLKAAERELAAAEKAEKTPPKVLKKAAAPKKEKKEKKAKKAKTPADVEKTVAEASPEEKPDESVVDEIDKMLDEGFTPPV